MTEFLLFYVGMFGGTAAHPAGFMLVSRLREARR